MKNTLLIFCVMYLSGCSFKPSPVRLSEIRDTDYVMACAMYLWQGEYKKTWAGVVYYDSEQKKSMGTLVYDPKYRVLVDDQDKALVFGSQMDLLNFFSKQGWQYVEPVKLEIREKMWRHFMLLERRQ